MKAFVLLLILCLTFGVGAHPADVTPLRVKVERQKLEFRFTISLYSLARMLPHDFKPVKRPTVAELEAIKPELVRFLQEHVLLRINDQTARLDTSTGIEPLWPVSAGIQVNETDLSVDIAFMLPWPEVIRNVWMEFTGFSELGELATLQATYEQGDMRMQVPFSPLEPDYLYDTGFAAEAIFAPAREEPLVEKNAGPSGRALPWLAAYAALAALSLLPHIFRKPSRDRTVG